MHFGTRVREEESPVSDTTYGLFFHPPHEHGPSPFSARHRPAPHLQIGSHLVKRSECDKPYTAGRKPLDALMERRTMCAYRRPLVRLVLPVIELP